MKVIIVALSMASLIIYLSAVVPSVAEGTPSPNVSNDTDTSPARIELKAELSHVMANDFDSILLSAYVYDGQGNPAPDGTEVNFTIGNAMANAYTGGFTWSLDNGSFSEPPGSGTYTNVTEGGIAYAYFGWVPREFGGNNSTIWAYVKGTSIYSTLKIYLSSSANAWTGRVVDPSGAGVGGIPVTLHLIGWDSTNNSYFEIYNMTRATSTSSSSAGRFAFYYISMQNALWYYVDSEALQSDNVTVYGRSNNFSINSSNTSIGLIILEASPKVTISTTPSVAVKPTPGFEALFALAGLPGIAYLIARKGN
jgi:hypothetical protein